uniref:Uncharacterized protein n=1 Tax=Steinernema glaseri TaxID=37863 RepID=A0A1I7ZEG6_9BILA
MCGRTNIRPVGLLESETSIEGHRSCGLKWDKVTEEEKLAKIDRDERSRFAMKMALTDARRRLWSRVR